MRAPWMPNNHVGGQFMSYMCRVAQRQPDIHIGEIVLQMKSSIASFTISVVITRPLGGKIGKPAADR